MPTLEFVGCQANGSLDTRDTKIVYTDKCVKKTIRLTPEKYYLCVNSGSNFAIEIIKGVELAKPIYQNKCYRIIGIAGGRKDAFGLVRRVVEEFVASGNAFDTFRDYLLHYEGERNVY